MDKIIFNYGEIRRIVFSVHSCKGQHFIISRANYILWHDGEAEDAGDCLINGGEISMILSPHRQSVDYILEVKYMIFDETYIKKVRLEVH